jgi:hypothetical protein
MSRNYLNSEAFRNYDASYNGRVWTEPANTHGVDPTPSDAEEAEDEESE